MLSFLDGKKSYIVGAVTVLVGVVELIGMDVVPSVTTENAFAFIVAGLTLITGKSAIKKLEPPE